MGGFSIEKFIMSKLTQETNGDPECGISAFQIRQLGSWQCLVGEESG